MHRLQEQPCQRCQLWQPQLTLSLSQKHPTTVNFPDVWPNNLSTQSVLQKATHSKIVVTRHKHDGCAAHDEPFQGIQYVQVFRLIAGPEVPSRVKDIAQQPECIGRKRIQPFDKLPLSRTGLA